MPGPSANHTAAPRARRFVGGQTYDEYMGIDTTSRIDTTSKSLPAVGALHVSIDGDY